VARITREQRKLIFGPFILEEPGTLTQQVSSTCRRNPDVALLLVEALSSSDEARMRSLVSYALYDLALRGDIDNSQLIERWQPLLHDEDDGVQSNANGWLGFAKFGGWIIDEASGPDSASVDSSEIIPG